MSGRKRLRLMFVPMLSLTLLLSGCSKDNLASSIEKKKDKVTENTNFDKSDDVSEKIVKKQINKIYDTQYSAEVKKSLENMKLQGHYDESNPLIVHNPYGTNTCSLYVYH